MGIGRSRGDFVLYPVNLHLAGKRCVVVGGGETALRKARGLLEAGASVTVVAKSLRKEFIALAKAEPLFLKKRAFSAEDVRDAFLVICATNDEAINRQAAILAKAAGALVNMAAPPLELGEVELPARMAAGELLVTISTGGKSPELSRRLRERFESKLRWHAEWLRVLAPYREQVKERLKESGKRQAFWRQALSDEVLDLVEQGELTAAEERIKNALDSFGA